MTHSLNYYENSCCLLFMLYLNNGVDKKEDLTGCFDVDAAWEYIDILDFIKEDCSWLWSVLDG